MRPCPSLAHLEAVEEVVANDDDGGAARGPALARRDCLDARDRRGRVEAFEVEREGELGGGI